MPIILLMITALYLCLGLLLAVAAIYDLVYRAIPVLILAVLVILSFIMPFVVPLSLQPIDSVWGGVIVGGVVLFIYLVTGRKGIGEADIFLSAVIGLVFGWTKGLLVFSAANVIGLIVMIPLMLIFGKKRTRLIPLGTFLVMAIFLEWAFEYSRIIISFLYL